MAAFDEKTTQRLRDHPLSREEAEGVYAMRRRLVVLSDVGLFALLAVSVAAGFVPWLVAAVVAALTLCLLPLALRIFRQELDEQVRSAEVSLGKSAEPRE